MAWKKHYFAKSISLDSKKECFVTNVRETDFEVLIQESFLRILKRNSVYEVTLSVADPGRGLGGGGGGGGGVSWGGPAPPPPPRPLFSDKTEKKCFFYFEIVPPPLISGAEWPPPSPPTPQIWRSGSAAVYYGTFSSIQWGFWPFIWIKAIMVSRQTVHSFKMLRLTFANRAAFCSFQNYLNVITNAVPVLC